MIIDEIVIVNKFFILFLFFVYAELVSPKESFGQHLQFKLENLKRVQGDIYY
jgi:hypothetical protein